MKKTLLEKTADKLVNAFVKNKTKKYLTSNNWNTEWYKINVFCVASNTEKEK